MDTPVDPHRLTEEEISKRLAVARVAPSSPALQEYPGLSGILNADPIPAAVLIPFLKRNNRWHLLYTRRNSNLPEHSGQVAFPGGRSDPEDSSPEHTALREAQEEIGLDPSDVKILGKLYDFITVTNYRVTPVVGKIPWPYNFHLASEEVSRVFTIPLDWLANPINFEERKRTLPGTLDPISVIYFNMFESEVLWGASARITLALIKSLNITKESS
jgi:8-oxo-dGTP pyrophosphatase MutT (NUDIX family)